MPKSMKKVHILAVGGIGMSALALLFLKKGWSVSGSDKVRSSLVRKLEESGLAWQEESDPLDQDLDAVFYSTAISSAHPQMKEALIKKIPTFHRSIGLSWAMEGKKELLVAGTHGKTTTSALLSHVFKSAGLDPSYAIGGLPQSLDPHAYFGSGEYFIAEADESDGSFINYNPYGMIITNVDADHMDYWQTPGALKKGFRDFAHKTKDASLCIFCNDSDLLVSCQIQGTSYGKNERSDYRLLWDEPTEYGRRFMFQTPDKKVFEGKIQLNGAHNSLNALGVFALADRLGLETTGILTALYSFKGVGRRCEIKGTVGQSLWIDDYGHHPAEIKTTLEGIYARFQPKRSVVVFQPHRFSRTHDLWDEFYTAFESAHELIVTDIYGAGEGNPHNLKALDLVNAMKKRLSMPIRYVAREDLKKLSFDQDLVVTFGAGDVNRLYEEYSHS